MSTFRVTALTLPSEPSAGAVVFRVTGMSIPSAATTIALTGPASAHAGATVQIVAVASDGSTSGVTFTQVAGPTVELQTFNDYPDIYTPDYSTGVGGGNTVSFVVPQVAASEPVNITIRATLTRAGSPDAVATHSVTVVPVAEFYLTQTLSWEPRVAYRLEADAPSGSTYTSVYKATY